MSCPVCNGLGWVRYRIDDIHDPRFGQAFPCECKQAERAERARERLQQLSGVTDVERKRWRVDTFDPQATVSPRSDFAAIKRACEEYAQKPEGWLVMVGPVGVGKSHLAYGIAGELLRRGVGVFAANTPSMLAMIRAGYDGEGMSAEQRIEMLKRVAVLVLDDFGVGKTTDWAQQTLFDVVDTRYRNRQPLVVTTNNNLRAEASKGDRLASRLLDRNLSQVLTLSAGDYRQRGQG